MRTRLADLEDEALVLRERVSVSEDEYRKRQACRERAAKAAEGAERLGIKLPSVMGYSTRQNTGKEWK